MTIVNGERTSIMTCAHVLPLGICRVTCAYEKLQHKNISSISGKLPLLKETC